MILQDIRLAVRLLLKDRWYTAVAVLALGLGIGVNSTIFTFVNAVLLRGLPYEDSHRIMYLQFTNPAAGQRRVDVSYPDYEDWRRGARSFEDLGAFRTGTMNVSDANAPAERALGAWISANTFGILGQPPLLGRTFLPGEDSPGAQPVALIGYELWQARYGRDPAILGRTIRVNEIPTRVVGVMPPGMKFPLIAEMWMPLVPDDTALRRGVRNLGVFARLRPGVSAGQAQAEMEALAGAIAADYPDTNRGLRPVVLPYNDRFNGGEIKLVFLSLMGAVALVLLVACANVANLLLARSASRAREMALRVSIGATRWRIIRQLLVESVLLGCVAGVFGLALSHIGVRLFDRAASTVQKPYWIDFTMDGPVFLFLAAICVLTGILFGLAPAVQVSRANVTELLKEGGRGGGTSRRARGFTSAMVVAEVACTIVLLVAAGLMVRSYMNVHALHVGFAAENLLGGSITLAEPKWNEAGARLRFQEELIASLRRVPGVTMATVMSALPLGGAPQVHVEGDARPVVDRQAAPRVYTVSVADDYFATLGMSVRAGRLFSPADGRAGNEAVIVNERVAAQLFDGPDAVGRRLRLLTDEGASAWMTVVGIAPNIRQSDPQTIEPEAVIYQPFRQDPTRAVGVLVRTAVPPASVAPAIRAAVRDVNPDQPLYNLKTFDELMSEVRWLWRVFGTLFAIFAVIALVLSAVGLYAVTAYAVAQRTQEIGVRIALGAARGQVSWLILKRGLLQLGAGTALGLVGAYFASTFLQSLLVQMSARDPVTFAAITALLLVITVAACLIPARRAMLVDPAVALRAE